MGREHRSEQKRCRDESPEKSKKRKKEKRSRSRSRSHTYSPSPSYDFSSRRRGGNRGNGGHGYYRRFYDGRDNPEPCCCLGVFGMSLHTNERDLKILFGRYGKVDSVQIVCDRYTGRSRGFGFVYFASTKDATRAKDHMMDTLIDGMKVRVDYSVTRGGGPYRHMQRTPSRSPVKYNSSSRSRSR